MSTRRKRRSSAAQNNGNKKSKSSNIVNLGFNVSNKFQSLADTDMDFDNSPGPSTSNQTPAVKKAKIPPIVVTQGDFDSTVINELNLSDITFKFISLGLKLSFDSKDSYDKCIDFLNQNNIEFFTHRLKNNIFKVILSGLPQVNSDDIKSELNTKYNINVVDVRELQTSYFNKNSRLYLISFENSEINLTQLRQIKAVNHTIVKWLRFSPKFKGPTQCRRCLMFGHGAENCHRSISCMFCASSEHLGDQCTFNNVPVGQLVKYICGNCKSRGLQTNHKANDPNCPCKLEYQNIRNHVRVRNSNQSNRSGQLNQNNHQSIQHNQSRSNSNQSNHQGQPRSNQKRLNANAPAFSLNQNQFPTLPEYHRHSTNPMTESRNSYTNATKNRQESATSSFDFQNSYANVSKNQLLSADEFFNIFEDALTKFYQCQSQADQFALIASLLRRAIR